MKQNVKNHVRWHPVYHFIIAPLVLAGLVLSSIHLAKSPDWNHYNAALIWLVFFLLLFIGSLTRLYALKLQNRVIRAEENLRHFMLTGKPLDAQLRLGQIIALRFASDEEFPALAIKAVEENIAPKEIKLLIQNWRGDYNRV